MKFQEDVNIAKENSDIPKIKKEIGLRGKSGLNISAYLFSLIALEIQSALRYGISAEELNMALDELSFLLGDTSVGVDKGNTCI